MAGKFTQQFSSQLASIQPLRFPKDASGRQLTPEEIRIQKAEAETRELQLEDLKRKQLEAQGFSAGVEQGKGLLTQSAEALRNQPVGVLSPMELSRQEDDRAYMDWQAYNKFMPPEKQVSFEDFKMSKRSKELDFESKKADISKKTAETPKTFGLSADERNILASANQAGPEKYRAAYNQLSPEKQAALPSPDMSQTQIAASLAAGGSSSLEGASFVPKLGMISDESKVKTAAGLQAEAETKAITGKIDSGYIDKKGTKILYPSEPPAIYQKKFDRLSDKFDKYNDPFEEQILQSSKLSTITNKYKDANGEYRDAIGEDAQALIFGFAKVLDPRSTVRGEESDAIATAAGGLKARMEKAVAQYKDGQMLPAEAVKQINDILNEYKSWAEKRQNILITEYGDEADKRGQDPFNIVGSKDRIYHRLKGRKSGGILEEGD